MKLPRAFYDRETVTVARDLLGARLVHLVDGARRVGRVVEAEAYLGVSDLAAHSSKGLTPRTRIMFGPPGFAYVYLIYGIHFCLNLVTEREGNACAVLVRAIEPLHNVYGKTSGPGLLCRAMGIDLRHNGHDLESDDLFLEGRPGNEIVEVTARPRVGVAYAGEWAHRPLRFYITGNPFVSKR